MSRPLIGPLPELETDAPGFCADQPQAFLVGCSVPELRVHFHPVPQFQVFTEGTARFGRHHVRRGSAHFSDPFTPYGPLRPDQEQVDFLTLRPTTDTGAFYMPESRQALGAKPVGQTRRNLTVDLLDPAPASSWTSLLHDSDGLEIAVIDCTAGEEVEVNAGGGGGFVLIVSGEASADGALLDPFTLRWLGAGDRCSVLPSSGTRVAILQFPTASLAV